MSSFRGQEEAPLTASRKAFLSGSLPHLLAVLMSIKCSGVSPSPPRTGDGTPGVMGALGQSGAAARSDGLRLHHVMYFKGSYSMNGGNRTIPKLFERTKAALWVADFVRSLKSNQDVK